MTQSQLSTELLLKAAVDYHKAGFRPVWLHAKLSDGSCTCGEPACGAAGKHPRFHDWAARAASATIQDIQEWSRKYPNSNIGLLCGNHPGVKVPIVAIDVDTREISGLTGIDRWDAWAETHRLPKDVPCQLTPSKGRHYIFASSGPVPTTTNIMPGVDIRGDKNGQIVVWPSPGYHWDCDLIGGALYELPASLLPSKPAAGAGAGTKIPESPIDLPTRIRRAKAWSSKVPGAISGQSGHKTTYAYAVGLVRGFCLPESEALKIAVAWNQTCQPPWSEKELIHKLSDATNKSDREWGFKLLSDIPRVAEPEPLPTPTEMPWFERLTRGKTGAIEKTTSNLMLILLHRSSVSYCEFSHKLWILSACDAFRTGAFPREWSDADEVAFSEFLATEYLIDCAPAKVASIIQGVEHHRSHHPVRDYLSSLQWDGKPRLADWLSIAFGAPPSPYLSDIGSKFLISAVARVMLPGCQADSMLVVKGPQGIGKSRLFRDLFHPWFADQIADLTNKDSSDNLIGVWGIEMSELEAVRGHAVTTVRAFISRSHERYRKAYARNTREIPRQCVFVGTTNEDVFLHDHAGARRTWVVAATIADRPWLQANKDQLWAEACQRWNNGEPWYLNDSGILDAAMEAAESVYAYDIWEDVVLGYARSHNMFTITDVMVDCLRFDLSRIRRADQTRVGMILSRAGYKMTKGNDMVRRYCKK